jgi:alkanesulfonate monooxygenase SsuD/methylene tetrahydromethanopterin reductase-like flavin-dependent oxidoreductase (luciferase family)
VVAPDDESAQKLAAGYAPWVRSIRKGQGAIPFPGPDEAGRLAWSDEDRALVSDRVDTQFVGSPQTVAAQLEVLRDAVDADELIVTTITHSHTDRIRSFTLLAQEWLSGAEPAPTPPQPAVSG